MVVKVSHLLAIAGLVHTFCRCIWVVLPALKFIMRSSRRKSRKRIPERWLSLLPFHSATSRMFYGAFRASTTVVQHAPPHILYEWFLQFFYILKIVVYDTSRLESIKYVSKNDSITYYLLKQRLLTLIKIIMVFFNESVYSFHDLCNFYSKII